MHIAICDNNIADRKQMERLLGRESDIRKKTTGVLYIDSFGDSASLLNAPMLYDLFFLDLQENNLQTIHLAEELRHAGVTAPIVLCYQEISEQPPSVPSLHHLKKPVSAKDLPPIIDMALAAKAAATHTVEIRCEKSTQYIEPEKMVYAVPQGHLTLLHFESGEIISMLGNLNDLYYLLESTKKFIFAKKNMLVNLDCIASLSFFKLGLKNGKSFPIKINDYQFIKKYLHAD